MLLNEIAKETGMTKRAVKYYEEKGLLSVHKDGNGYRNYSPQDVETLKILPDRLGNEPVKYIAVLRTAMNFRERRTHKCQTARRLPYAGRLHRYRADD